MFLPTKSSNDDKTHPSEAQFNLQLLNDVLPDAALEEAPSHSDDPSRKRALDRPESSTAWDYVPKNLTEMRAMKADIIAKRRKTTPRVDEDVDMTVTEGSSVKIDITGPVPPPAWRLDWKNIRNPERFPRVAVQAGQHPVIGSAGYHPKGFGINLLLDGGMNGQPCVSLIIRVNKENPGQELTDKEQDLHRFVLHYPINKVIGKNEEGKNVYMVDSFNHAAFNPSETPAVKDDLYREGRLATKTCKPGMHGRIIALQMVVNSVIVTEGGTAEDLQAVVQRHPDSIFGEAVTELLTGPFPMTLTLWFEWTDYTLANAKCLSYIDRALELRVPPLAQYYNKDQQLALNIGEAETVDRVGGGMYQIHDKQGKPVGIRQMPKLQTWQDEAQFRIYNSLTAVREAQYVEGMTAYLALIPFKAYVMAMPDFTAGTSYWESREAKKSSATRTPLDDQFFVFIRIPKVKGEKESPPVEGTIITLQPNTMPGMGRQAVPDAHKWQGVVVHRDSAEHDALGTDFCVQMLKPKGAPMPLNIAKYGEHEHIKEGKLWSVWLNANVSQAARKREQKAINAFLQGVEPDSPAATLKAALCGRRFPGDDTVVDLTGGPNIEDSNEAQASRKKNRAKYQSRLKRRRKEMAENMRQFEVLEKATCMRGGFQAVVGIPGSGKTRTLTQVGWDLAAVGHKLLLCAPNNDTLDHDARAVYLAKPKNNNKKFLRLQTNGLELAGITKIADVDQTTDKSRPLKAKLQEDVLDDNKQYQIAYLQALAEMQTADNELLEAKISKLDDLEAAGKDYEQAISARGPSRQDIRSDLPAEMTLKWRVQDLMHRDQVEAQEQFDSELDRLRKNGVTQPDLDGRIADGTIASVGERDKSFEYRKHLDEFAKAHGSIHHTERTKFETLRMSMVARILEETDILFVTFNNAGGDILKSGFAPTVALFDEVGQATLPAVLVPLTQFPSIQGLFWFGDPTQLEPTILSMTANEVAQNSKMSPLEMVTTREDCPVIILNTQYRMCPTISSVVSRFYPDGIVDSDEVKQDNETRRRVRAISTKHYGLKIPSEVIAINVERGISRVETNGTSLMNYANVDAMATAIDHCLAEGIEPSQITVLTFYKGEKMLALKKLDNGKLREICTVDSYQGRENEVVFVDYVTARRTKSFPSPEVGDDNAEVLLHAAEMKSRSRSEYSLVSAHIKDKHRNCLALSRARSGLFLFFQEIQWHKMKLAHDNTFLGGLLTDLWAMKLVYCDHIHFDTHPRAIEERADNNELADAWDRSVEKASRLTFAKNMQDKKRLDTGNMRGQLHRGGQQSGWRGRGRSFRGFRGGSSGPSRGQNPGPSGPKPGGPEPGPKPAEPKPGPGAPPTTGRAMDTAKD